MGPSACFRRPRDRPDFRTAARGQGNVRFCQMAHNWLFGTLKKCCPTKSLVKVSLLGGANHRRYLRPVHIIEPAFEKAIFTRRSVAAPKRSAPVTEPRPLGSGQGRRETGSFIFPACCDLWGRPQEVRDYSRFSWRSRRERGRRHECRRCRQECLRHVADEVHSTPHACGVGTSG